MSLGSLACGAVGRVKILDEFGNLLLLERRLCPPFTLRDADTHDRIRHDRVDTTGCVTLRHNSRLHHIGIGRTHAGTHVTLIIQDLDIRIINPITGEILRDVTLDPSRDYQPTHQTPETTKAEPTKRVRLVADLLRDHMAVPVGFEPTVGSHPHNFSRVAPSATRTRYRRRS